MNNNPISWWCSFIFIYLGLAVAPALAAAPSDSEEKALSQTLTNQPTTSTPVNERTTSPAEAQVSASELRELLKAYLQLQQQLHDALLAIEQNRREAAQTSSQSTESVTASLRQFQSNFTEQRQQDLALLQSSLENSSRSNRSVIALAGVVAGAALLALVAAAWLQLRAINRLAVVASSAAASHLLPAATGTTLSLSDPLTHGDASQASAGLRKAVETLEHRIRELEHTTSTHHPMDPDQGPGTEMSSRASTLVGKGQALLSLNDAEGALNCFEEALADSAHPDIWIKKGTALEKLRRLEEAIQCYDRAIELNEASTLAYLYKGGVYNQLERFNDAIQCYEQALRSQQKQPSIVATST